MLFEFYRPYTTVVVSNESTGYGAPAPDLPVGETCSVVKVSMGDTSTRVMLTDGKWYNSVHFSLDLTRFIATYQAVRYLSTDGIFIKHIDPNG